MRRRITSIDIGSTNSQIAQIIMVSKDGKNWKCEKEIKKEEQLLIRTDGSENHPTVILQKCDLNQDQKSRINIESDALFGITAQNVQNTFYDVKLVREFKKDLFYTPEERSKDPNKQKLYDDAIKYVGMFLKYLKKRESEERTTEAEEEITYITVPVRAQSYLRERMHTLAEEAGWKNVCIRDEAESILRYALAKNHSELYGLIGNLTRQQKLWVLILDIGGSTTDILLTRIGPDGSGNFNADIVGQWPDEDESYTLGGIDIDKKLCEWLVDGGYLQPDAVKANIKWNGYGYFREFKEMLSVSLRNNAEVEELLGNIKQLEKLEQGRNTIWSDNDYKKSDRKISPQIYCSEIAKEYVELLGYSIGKMLDKYNLAAEDIDYVMLSGGGAKMYGIEELLLGTYPGLINTINFAKAKRNSGIFIPDYCNPSALCALGNVLPVPNIPFKNHSSGQYELDIRIYAAPSSNTSGWDKEHEKPVVLPDKFIQVYRATRLVLAKDGEALPMVKEFHYTPIVDVKVNHSIVYVIQIDRVMGKKRSFQKAWTSFSMRTPGRTFADLFKNKSESRKIRGDIKVSVTIEENRTICITPLMNFDGNFGLLKKERKLNG